MHTLRDAFGYTNVLKDLTNAGITIRKPQLSSVMDVQQGRVTRTYLRALARDGTNVLG